MWNNKNPKSLSGLVFYKPFFLGFDFFIYSKGVPMAVEDMYKTGGLEYVKTFCNEIDGFIYKVLLFIFH